MLTARAYIPSAKAGMQQIIVVIRLIDRLPYAFIRTS
jgi:hypothetical protein